MYTKKLLATVCFALILTSCSCNKSMKDGSAGSMAGSSVHVKNQVGNIVHFAYDRSSLTPESTMTLDKQAALMKGCDKNATFTIEGYCDKRGTVEYNLALGERRANSVKKYLTEQKGIDPKRLNTVSYGHNKQLVEGPNTEEVYAQNRAAVTVKN